MAELSDLTTVASTNTARFGEGQLVPQINDGGRELEAMIGRWFKDTNGSIASSGSSTAFAILTNRTIPAHAAGLEFKFRATNANNGATTIAINALTAKPLVRSGGADLVTGDIVANQIVHIVYNSATDEYECLGINA